MTSPQSTRIYVLLARNAPEAVILRRGPSKRVQLISWNTDTDEFIEGQWLKGRVYERRCDLSPSGKLFCYFAAKWKGPIDTWTAISKPPFFTALALWSKGDAWGGGGLFESDHVVLLNHPENQTTLRNGLHLAPRMTVKPLNDFAGCGEDDPIHHMRLIRDGWQLLGEGGKRKDRDSKVWLTFDPPILYAKKFSFSKNDSHSLRMMIHGLHEKDGPWYVMEFGLAKLCSKLLRLKIEDFFSFCRFLNTFEKFADGYFRLAARGSAHQHRM